MLALLRNHRCCSPSLGCRKWPPQIPGCFKRLRSLFLFSTFKGFYLKYTRSRNLIHGQMQPSMSHGPSIFDNFKWNLERVCDGSAGMERLAVWRWLLYACLEGHIFCVWNHCDHSSGKLESASDPFNLVILNTGYLAALCTPVVKTCRILEYDQACWCIDVLLF